VAIEPVVVKTHRYDPDGVQKLYRFHNLRGASVIRGQYSYGGEQGLWEIMPVRFHSEEITDFELDYLGSVYEWPKGWLNDEQLNEELEYLANLEVAQ